MGHFVRASTLRRAGRCARDVYQTIRRRRRSCRDIPKGTIYGILQTVCRLATSNGTISKCIAPITQHSLGIDLWIVRAQRMKRAHYPVRGLTFALLGDLRTACGWCASTLRS